MGDAKGELRLKDMLDLVRVSAPNASLNVRFDLLAFVRLMEAKLKLRDHRGDQWRETPIRDLYQRALDELGEFDVALCEYEEGRGEASEIISEAVDVANFMMFMAMNLIRKAHGGPPLVYQGHWSPHSGVWINMFRDPLTGAMYYEDHSKVREMGLPVVPDNLREAASVALQTSEVSR